MLHFLVRRSEEVMTLKEYLSINDALSDETRVRALLALRNGEQCLCQIVELLGLAPSTLSKHLDVLYRAGLVERARKGRWRYFRLAGKEASEEVRRVIDLTLDALRDEPVIEDDARKVRRICRKDLSDLVSCYRK